jgi:hypothetical protein
VRVRRLTPPRRSRTLPVLRRVKKRSDQEDIAALGLTEAQVMVVDEVLFARRPKSARALAEARGTSLAGAVKLVQRTRARLEREGVVCPPRRRKISPVSGKALEARPMRRLTTALPVDTVLALEDAARASRCSVALVLAESIDLRRLERLRRG